MALVNNGIDMKLIGAMIPTGYTDTPATKFTDQEYQTYSLTLAIAKSGVENANKVTTFTNLRTALNTAIETLINSDFDTTANTVTIYTAWNWVKLTSCGTADDSV